MRWLLHGSLTPAASAALVRHEHKTHAVSELKLAAESAAAEILAGAAKNQWDILTTDAVLSRLAVESPGKFNRCIVYLQLSGGDVEQDDAIDRLFARYPRLTPMRLYTVTESRVKVRQLPKNI